MKLFNAFQIICLFTAAPYVIGWLGTNPFTYSVALFWAAIAAYVVGFIGMVAVVREVM